MRTKLTLLVLCVWLGTCIGSFAQQERKIITDPGEIDMKQRTEELQQQRFGMFICWSFSTFSGYEWSPGVEDISFFNPTGCDTDQWVKTAKEAGMGYILFLTKHHDGFCLWDTETTDRKITNSPLKRDVLQEMKKSCDKYGIKLALYFSEGDWSWSGRKDIHTSVAKPEIKKAQLKELLTKYGPIEYIWFDHAVGDGGLSHEETAKFVKSLQPGCFVGFNHGEQDGADIRLGERGKPAPLNEVSAEAIGSKERAKHMQGHKGYYLAEFTYPILEGQKRKKVRGAQWFYSLPENDNLCASAEKIYRDYLGAEKYDNIFSLDVGPDRSGKLRKIDVETMQKVGQYIRGELKLPTVPVSQGKPATASSVWQGSKGLDPAMAFDGNPETRWGAEEESRNGWLAVDLEKNYSIGRCVIDEGEWGRLQKFEVQYRDGENWKKLAKVAGGGRQELKFDSVTAQHFRLMITESSEVPTIVEFALFEVE